MISDDMALVREYAQSNCEQAFATLVSRHVNLVYSVALRQVRDPHLAEEITQSVFIILAGKAKSLSPKTILSGWLCRTARYVSANTLSIQRRRQIREQEAHMESILNEREPDAWDQMAPLLDEALSCLGEKDHDAVVLRFFYGKELKYVGAAMGTTEDAARMRVNRGVDKLREFFTKKGVTLSTTAIAGAVAANSVQAAPAGLSATITAAALSGTATTTTAVIAVTKAIAMTTLQKALVAAAFTVIVGTGIYEASQASRLRDENQSLTRKQEELLNEHDAALSAATANKDELENSKRNHAELLRLRGEVGVLRKRSKELEKSREENRQLLSTLARAETTNISRVDTLLGIASLETELKTQQERLDVANQKVEQLVTTWNVPDEVSKMAVSDGLESVALTGYWPYLETRREREELQRSVSILKMKVMAEKIELGIEATKDVSK
jgi:RNA polymerase sigma factor (sigma-70 family)